MFDIGFLEIFIVLVVAILALGPDKLPEFISSAVKVIKGVKKTISDAQESVEKEIQLEDMKKEVEEYKKSIEYTNSTILENNSLDDATKEINKIEKQLNYSYQDDKDSLVEDTSIEEKKEKKDKKKKKKKKRDKDV
jgi:sec-independent protein translocase protein TatB